MSASCVPKGVYARLQRAMDACERALGASGLRATPIISSTDYVNPVSCKLSARSRSRTVPS
jgi:hypothetical protein